MPIVTFQCYMVLMDLQKGQCISFYRHGLCEFIYGLIVAGKNNISCR